MPRTSETGGRPVTRGLSAVTPLPLGALGEQEFSKDLRLLLAREDSDSCEVHDLGAD